MGTAVGIQAVDGVVIAADRRAVDETGRVKSNEVDHLFTAESCIAGVTGAVDGVQAVHRELDMAVRNYSMEHQRPPTVDAVSRMASDIVSDAGADCLLAARNEHGEATLVYIDTAGGSTVDDRFAIGDGAELLWGQLDQIDSENSSTDLQNALAEAFEAAAARHGGIGSEINTETLPDR